MSDWDAERYHRLSNPQLGWGRRVLERLAPDPNERILDLGCGTGRLTAELFAVMREGLVVAVDRSQTMLQQAAAQNTWHAGPHPLDPAKVPARIHVVRADGLHLPFSDAFDAILSTATFHWILDHDLLFASIYRALVPGGRLVAQCGGAGNLAALLTRADALRARPLFAPYFAGWQDPWNFASVPETITRLDRAGFTAIDVWMESTPTTLPERATYREFLWTVCVREHVARLPDDLRAQFLDALADAAAADAPPFTLDYWRLNIYARKPAGIEQAA
ncbi:MAG TPA: methyltransferase domain-containing protein [Vicinamibacterales bacterium]|nr:methyltransferase domain-containing protein [Vicinamibacterales bacterium]